MKFKPRKVTLNIQKVGKIRKLLLKLLKFMNFNVRFNLSTVKSGLHEVSSEVLFFFHLLIYFSRLLWTVVLINMLTWMVFNISLRVKAYLDSPIRVNIDVKQHTQLKFPAVTICNKNFAR